ncbi:voltage-dependent calcium channel beta subunit-associated regulatory protein-like [Salmo trutta]|uniref:Voltage-dependent calcium channel beta subunit-associated regulatory protein-like n=1 Tax=Salmo trutta TaxID=8032 RepID=A0A673YM95_SALTR|nr:voltage-dependent calcium channel beta subunit-associated regulatory protein-like [Salmo trutta]
MSNDLPVLTSLTENSTELPVSAGRVENYVLLLILLCVFAGGTLILLSLLSLFCHRCCVGGRRYSRASDDPEKTNTTYVEDSLPTQDITIRLDESDALFASSCHDEETDRFMSTCSTGRRVSFNESALYEKESQTQDKGRRYTLTEGDFHHLKKARLTHLHMAPPPSTLKILTIMECESTEISSLNVNKPPASKLPLYQCSERAVPTWLGQSSSGALPGDTHHYILLDPRLSHSPPILCPPTPCSRTAEAVGDGEWVRMEGERERGMRGVRGTFPVPGHQGSVLQFFCKLRRHASLEGAGPYFRKWKFDSSHRATSLDAKGHHNYTWRRYGNLVSPQGSPKRRPFQRQRAASDNTVPTEEDSPPPHPSPPLRHDIPQPLPPTHSQISSLQHLSARSLSPPTCPPSPSLGRLEGEAVVEAASRGRRGRDVTHPPPEHPGAQGREEEPVEMTETGLLREAGTEKETRSWAEVGAVTRTEAGEEFKVWVGSGEESEEGAYILGTEQRVGHGAEIMVWEGLGTDEAQEGGERFQAEQEAEMRIKARTVDGLGATSKAEAGMGVRAKTDVGAVLGTEKETETGARLESVIEVGARPEAEFEVEVGLGASVVRISDLGSGLEGFLGAGIGADPGPRSRSGSAVCISRQESSETQPSLCRDIWSLRASLEQYTSSDQSSTDRESIRSDVDSVCSVGGAAGQSSFTACLSQDIGDELEGEWEYGDTEREEGDRRQKETEGEAEYRDTGRKMVNRGVQRRDSEGEEKGE